MSGNHWHKRYHSDALTGFMSLTLEERGAYQTVLDLIYDRGGPIMDNDRLMAGYMGVSLRKWAGLRASLIAKGKITIGDGFIENDRAIFEIKNSLKTSRKHAENGLKGARKLSENKKLPNENNESELARLKPGCGLSRSQKLEAAKAANACEEKHAPDLVVSLAHELSTLAGCCLPDQRNIIENQVTVRGWLKAGVEAQSCRDLIASRMAAGTTTPRTLKYFDAAIREIGAGQSATPAAGKSKEMQDALAMAERILKKSG